MLMTDADRAQEPLATCRAARPRARRVSRAHALLVGDASRRSSSDRLAVRHPLLVIRVRLAVAVWLCIVTGVLCSRGYWWLGAGVACVHRRAPGRCGRRARCASSDTALSEARADVARAPRLRPSAATCRPASATQRPARLGSAAIIGSSTGVIAISRCGDRRDRLRGGVLRVGEHDRQAAVGLLAQ